MSKGDILTVVDAEKKQMPQRRRGTRCKGRLGAVAVAVAVAAETKRKAN